MKFTITNKPAQLAARAIGLALTAWLAASASHAATIDFEDLSLPPNSYYNGDPGGLGSGESYEAPFTSGGATFNHRVDGWGGGSTTWGGGWAYSNMADLTTPGYENQYSAYHLPSGGNTAGNFAIAYGDSQGGEGWGANPSISFGELVNVQSASITNTTYAALSMLSGDGFAKKFGGISGDDPDYFSVTIQGRVGGISGEILDEVEFFLADFRFSDNSLDYVISEWTDVLLNFMGIDTLTFAFASSDVGGFGINTPTYFALDNLHYTSASAAAVPEPSTLVLGVLGGIVGFVWKRRRAARKGEAS